jgi:hypothetical protein
VQINLAGHNNVPLFRDVCLYPFEEHATPSRSRDQVNAMLHQVNAALHQVAMEQNDTICLLKIEPKEMLSMYEFHNCKLISNTSQHMLFLFFVSWYQKHTKMPSSDET